MGNNQPACPMIFEHEHWYNTYSIYKKETLAGGKGTIRSVGIVCERDGVFIKTNRDSWTQGGWQKYNKGRLVSFPEAAGEHLTISKREARRRVGSR